MKNLTGSWSLCQTQHQPNQPSQLGVSSGGSAQPGHVTFSSWDEAAGNLLWHALGWGQEGVEGRGCGHSQLCGDTSQGVHLCRFACTGV